MQLVRLGQLYNASDLSKEQKVELVNNIDTAYTIPDNTYRNLQEKSCSGYNCLHVAALKLDFDFICEFLKRGADVLVQGENDGRTPVHVVINSKTNCKGKKLWEISGKLQDCQIVNILLFAHISSNNPFSPKCKDGISHLHIACMFNCVEAVKFFLKNGQPINQVTNADAHWPSFTPLHFAMRYSSVETAEILLTKGADLFAKDAEGTSPLQILINRLLNVADYITMGQYTINLPYEEEFKRLEAIGNIVIKLRGGCGVNVLDDTGFTTFHIACILKNASLAESFLNDNFDLNMPIKTDSKFWPGWTLLHFAAYSSVEIVKLLMRKGADITIKNKKGQTPLDMCLKRYPPEMVHSILSIKEEFKNVLLSDNSTKLLDLIFAMNDITSFQKYIETLDQFNISVSSSSPILPGYSLLHLALSMNARTKSWDDFVTETHLPETINSLPKVYNSTDNESCFYRDRIDACLAIGCSVDLKNNDGSTPIHLAFKTHLNRSDIFELLLNYSKKDVVDPDGLSHLHIACAVGNQKAVKMLLDARANINAIATKSFQWYKKSDEPCLIFINADSTPLHVAVTFEHTNIVEYLLDTLADFYAIDSEGFTPIHLSMSRSSGSNEIAKMIIDRPQELIEMLTNGLSHLHVAAFAGDASAIMRLIHNGADVNLVVPDFLSRFAGKTPIQIVTQSSGDIIDPALLALIDFGADIYANDTLQCLMGKDDVDFSEYLVARLKLNENVKGPINSSGLTLLHIACSRFDVKWAKELLSKGADVNARIRDDEDYQGRWKGYTPLHALIARKNVNRNETVRWIAALLGQMLLDRGADVTIDADDGTPLHMDFRDYMRKVDMQDLVSHKYRGYRTSILDELLNRGADVTIDSQDGTPLHSAYCGYKTERPTKKPTPEPEPELHHQGLRQPGGFSPRLVDERLFSHWLQPGALQMPLHMRFQQMSIGPRIAWQRHEVPVISSVDVDVHKWKESMASSMLRSHKNFRINPIGPDGFSHFHFFCMTDQKDGVKEFLDNGVDINHSTNPFATDEFAGYTALHLAIKYQVFRIVHFLVERGADVNVEGADGNTPLHLMVMQTSRTSSLRTEILSLKKHGAKFNVRNLQGESPADVLMTRDFTLEQFQFLLSNGSSINPNKNKSIHGPAALIMQNGTKIEIMQLFKLFINVCDIRAAVKGGYSPIQDTVKAKYGSFTTVDYLNIVADFLNLGCDVDQLDDKGCTALHNAIILGNGLAVHIFLQVGADVNACNVSSEFFAEKGLPEIEQLIAYQVYKMHKLGLDVSDAANSVYREFRRRVTMKGHIALYIDLELDRARKIKFTRGISARAFLSELWGTAHYSRLSLTDRQNVDAFFKNIKSVTEEFSVLCGLMLCQYNKALARPKLMQAAVEILGSECEIYLPQLPLECIVSFISNERLKYLIKHSERGVNFFQET